MNNFSNNFSRIGTETAFAVGPEIAALEKQGFDIIKVNIGEPGANICPAAEKALIRSVKDHETHYAPPAGVESLRQAISAYVTDTRGINYSFTDTAVAPGGKPVICAAFLILVNPGDEVIYPTPGYPIYESMAGFCRAKPISIVLKEKHGFRLDVDELKTLISRKTKLLVLNSPSNPTGGVLTEADYRAIARLAEKFNFYILADEIYSRIAFPDHFRIVEWQGRLIPITHSLVSLPGMAERTVLMDGFSKTYAMTGLRIGYAVSKIPGFIDKFITFAINFWTNIPVPVMRAGEAALLSDQSEAQAEIADYRRKRDMTVTALNKISGISCHKPLGSFYLFPNVTKICRQLKLKDAEALRRYLLTYDKKHKKGVAVLSRQHFGRRQKQEKEEYIRISIAGRRETLTEAVRRIKEAVEHPGRE